MPELKAQTKLHLLIDQKLPVKMEVFLQIADEDGADAAWAAYLWTSDFYRRNNNGK